jgi:glycosyltransferase involved in cell wall biosynthesis
VKQSTSGQRVAITHDWLVGGGAERVVYEIHKLYPQAPIFTAYHDETSLSYFKNADIRTSYMQNFPFSKLRKLLPILRQRWFESLDLQEYDLVISSSGAEAKGVKTLPDTLHVNYCHTPTHYYWVRYQEYMDNPGVGLLDPLARFGLKHLLKYARKWDYKAAQRPNYIVANSTAVQARIEEFYNRESVVIHPPVDIQRFKPKKFDAPRSGFVIAGRQTPYKRIDLAVAACTKAQLPLTVIGNGPEHAKLRRLAGPTITFLTEIEDMQMPEYFQKAWAFIFPNEDDFGITPVEAMAAGAPVIAYKAGGALDYVVPNKTGVFFEEQSPEALAEILQNFKPEKFDAKIVSKHAENFSAEVFSNNLLNFIKKIQAKE